MNQNSIINLFININGKNDIRYHKVNLSLHFDDKINNIEFFNGFVEEVTFIYMFS